MLCIVSYISTVHVYSIHVFKGMQVYLPFVSFLVKTTIASFSLLRDFSRESSTAMIHSEANFL